jgi:hypothetical protein
MSDEDEYTVGEFFRGVRLAKQQRHRENKDKNTTMLAVAGLVFTIANNGEVLCFREPNMPKVDFFPSSGKWYVQAATSGKVGTTYHGGAHGFIGWYKKQQKKVKLVNLVDEIVKGEYDGV